jgi:pimeloyl-ACP methyl ester carboxylesterase
VAILWSMLADRTVEWARNREEQRLYGQPAYLRTFGEWTAVVFSTLAMSILTICTILITSMLLLRSLDCALAPLGQQYWVEGDKYRIHVYCSSENNGANGTAVPTVLFEGGEQPVENGLWQFAEAAVQNGSISRYCFADRPGFGWSDTAPSPLSAGMAEDALSEALARAGEHGPWVVCGAGIGAIYSRVFSARHGQEVLGMVLVDPVHEDLLYRVGEPIRGLVLWLWGIISSLGIFRVPAAIFKGQTSEDRIWGNAARRGGKYILAKLQESLVADSLTKRDVISSRAIQHQDTPLILISSGEQLRDDSEWESKQRDLCNLTQTLKSWDIATDSPHEVWKTWQGRALMEKSLKELVSQGPVKVATGPRTRRRFE